VFIAFPFGLSVTALTVPPVADSLRTAAAQRADSGRFARTAGSADNGMVRIGVLGALQVRDSSGRPVAVSGPRVRALLAVLALDADRVVPAGVLIDRIWDDPPAGALNALQSTVSRLRAALQQAGIAVESQPPGYRLALARDLVDALAFERLATEGSTSLRVGDTEVAARRLGEALDLWHGPALADLTDTNFGTGMAARLEELRRTAILDRAEADLDLGGGPELAAELRSLADANPLAERTQALLMRALYKAGQQADALVVYTRARDALAAELGVDPSPELEQTYLAVLRQQLPARSRPEPGAFREGPRPAVSVRLPAQLTSFVGREKETGLIADLLTRDRLVTLTGTGGVGKTRLAIECASRLAETMAHGVCLTELGPLADPAEVPGAVLAALGLGGGGLLPGGNPGSTGREADPMERLAGALASHEVLLVLDNCEHLIDAAAALADAVLAGCPRVRILATSREPLGITGEVIYSVPPLESPPELGAPAPADVLAYPAARLFTDRAVAGAGFAIDEDTALDVARICRALDGIPLAIELAAARLRTLSAAQVAERLSHKFTLLTGGSRTAAARHRTLRAVVDWSWEMLSGRERMLARRLAVFRGGATLEAAQRVGVGRLTGPDDLPGDEVVDVLAALVDKSLVIADWAPNPVGSGAAGQEGTGRRYRMLETIREYCLDQLTAAGERDQVHRVHAEYFLGLAEDAEPELRRAGQLYWMRILITENENLNAAVRWSIDRREADLALRLAGALGYYWFLRGKHVEQRPLADALLALAWPGWRHSQATVTARTAADRPALAGEHAWAVVCCVLVFISQSFDIERVRTLMLAAAEAAESAATPPHPMMALARPVIAQFDVDFAGALAALGPALASPDPWVAALARALRAGIACSQGRLNDAAADCATAERAFRGLGERWGVASTLIQSGYVAGLRGDHDTEIAALNEAAKLAHEVSAAEDDEADLLSQLALAQLATGDVEAARTDLDRAWKIAERIGHDDSWLQAISADLARLTGDLVGARARYEAALGDLEMKSKPFQHIKAAAMAGLALIALAERNLAEAADLLTTALRTAAESGVATSIATVLETIAAFSLADGAEGGDTSALGLSRRAERAATLLGAAHGVRGGADSGHPDVAAVTAAARNALGQASFDRRYADGQSLPRGQAVSFAFAGLPAGIFARADVPLGQQASGGAEVG
jgi:predicted ATPase/DNA-binding SARP family transcriptional activator